MSKKHLLGFIAVFLFGLFLGFSSGPLFMGGLSGEEGGQGERRVTDANFPLINQLIDSEPEQNTKSAKYRALEDEIKRYLDKEMNTGSLIDAAVYVRDLSNGPWIGINFDDEFAPASLLKLPVAIAIYKKAEEFPEILKKQLSASFSADLTTMQHIQPSQHIDVQKKETVEKLIQLMLANSDNNAYMVLGEALGEMDISPDRVYKDLGVGYTISQERDLLITMRQYSSFFRVLYNASYLRKNSSNTILTLLSQSEYRRGMVSKLPHTVTVAHKFGERQYNNAEENQQLHDCGIVYKPGRPYLLCIMTKGNNQKKLEEIIGTISFISYSRL